MGFDLNLHRLYKRFVGETHNAFPQVAFIFLMVGCVFLSTSNSILITFLLFFH
jgi:hypothetical protein